MSDDHPWLRFQSIPECQQMRPLEASRGAYDWTGVDAAMQMIEQQAQSATRREQMRSLLASADLPSDDATVDAVIATGYPFDVVAVMAAYQRENQARTIQPHPMTAIIERCLIDASRPMPPVSTPKRRTRKRRVRR